MIGIANQTRRNQLVLYLVLSSLFFNLIVELHPKLGLDFDVYRAAGQIITEGKSPELYQKAEQLGHGAKGFFYHLPYEALAFVPFSGIPRNLAFGLWNAFQALLVGVGGGVLAPCFPRFQRWVVILTALSFYSMPVQLFWGQDAGITFLIFAVAFRLFYHERDFVAGLALAAGLYKFQYVIPVIAYLIVQRRTRLLKGFVSGCLAVGLISWAMIGKSGVLDYWSLLRYHGAEDVSRMVSLRAALEWLGIDPRFTIPISAVLFIALCFVKLDRSVGFGIAVCVGSLLSFHGYTYDSFFLLIPIFIALSSAQRPLDYWPVAFLFSPLVLSMSIFHLWPTLAICSCLLVATLILIDRGQQLSYARHDSHEAMNVQ